MSDDSTSNLPRPEKRATRKMGQRELTRLSTAVVLVILALLLVAGYRVFRNFKSQRDIVIAKSNLLALYKAISNYAQDWDGHLPPAATWTDAVAGYLSASPGTPGGKESYLHGPGDGPSVGYVYNDKAAGFDMDPSGKDYEHQKIAPGDLVLLIERPGARPNEHVSIPAQGSDIGEQALLGQLQFPHYADDKNNATTVMMFANGTLLTRTRRDFQH